MAYSFDLAFTKPKETDLPGPPRAAIYIKNCTGDDHGRIFITPQDCESMEKLDIQINRLKNEIEDIRKKAKRQFSGK